MADSSGKSSQIPQKGDTADLLALGKKGYEAWKRDQPSVIGVDTETDGKFFPFCVTIAWDGEAHYFERTESANEIAEILAVTPTWVFHNAKFDLGALLDAGLIDRADISPAFFEDTETMAHLLNEHQKRGLKFLAGVYLGESTDEAERIKEAKRKLKLRAYDGYDKLPRDLIVPYAIKDAEFTYRLYERFLPNISGYADLSSLYLLEKELTVALLDMERAGMGLDLDYLNKTAKDYKSRALEVEFRIRDEVGDEDFNPNSPQQVLEALAKRGINLSSTGQEFLRPHRGDALVDSLMELRKLQKMSSTYLEAINRERNGNKLHPNFRQHGTRTGRMSSGSHQQ